MANRTALSGRLGRNLCAIAMIAGVATIASVTESALAQAPVNSIDVSVRAPDAIADVVDVRLLLDGADVTDASCGPLMPPTPLSGPNRQCTDIADGTYTVDVVGEPADAVTVWDCSDIVATPAPHTAIPISADRFNEWFCGATTALPGALLDQFGDGELATVTTRLFDSAGADITSSCTQDEQSFGGQWCTGLDDGTYEVRPDALAEGYRASIGCGSYDDSFESAAPISSVGSFTVDAARPLWQCSQPFVFAPLSFQVAWQGSFGRDTTWFENLAPVVTDQAGVEQSTSCSVALGSADEGFYVYDCPGLIDGTYSIVVPNIPDGFDVDNTCTDVVVSESQVDEGAACDVLVASVDIIDDPIDPADDTDDGVPVDRLPDTGVPSSVLALIGAALVLAGLALLGLGGRRRPPSFGV